MDTAYSSDFKLCISIKNDIKILYKFYKIIIYIIVFENIQKMTPENMKVRSDESLKRVDWSVLRYIGKNDSQTS